MTLVAPLRDGSSTPAVTSKPSASGRCRPAVTPLRSVSARAGVAASLTLLFFAIPARATVVVEVSPSEARIEAIAAALSAEVERALERAASGSLVVRVRSELPEAAPDPHALIEALVRPTADGLAGRFEVVHVAAFGGDGPECAATAARLGYRTLVDVSIRAVGNFLRIEGAVWTTDPAARHGELDVRSRLDAEVRRYVGAAPRVTADTVVARTLDLPGRGYLSLSALDLDRDGRTELVLLHEGSIAVLRLGAVQGSVRLVEVARAEVPADVPLAPAPPRRPLATSIELDGAVIVRASGLAAPLRVELAGDTLAITRATGPCGDDEFPIDRGCARLSEGRDFFDEAIASFEEGGAPHEATAPWYAHAARRLRTPEGTTVDYEAMVNTQGRLALRVRGLPNSRLGFGTALAMTDLDDDGSAELLASGPTAVGDQLTLLRALPRGALHVVWRSEPIEGSIWIAESGDLDGDGAMELLAIEEPAGERANARLWVVR